MSIDDLYAVIPAGGAGTRLWPISRRASPKFLHDLTGDGVSLLRATVDRLAPLADERILVVTGEWHREAVLAQLPALDPDLVVAEPSPRDSMAAIGLAAALVERRDPEAVIGSFAADHVIADPEAFRDRIAEAVAVARDGWLVTIGIEPTHPATGFGYIEVGEPVAGHPAARHVVEFVEKPDRAVAEEYLAGGRHRWNAGMFVVRPTVLLDLLAEGDPAFAAALRAIAADPGSLAETWPSLPRIAVDHAVAEPAAASGRVAVVPGSFGWDDVGDYASLAALLTPGEDGTRVLGDDALVHAPDGAALVVPGTGRTVAVLGVPDLVVVDTPDALLVTTRAEAQRVKSVVDWLADTGRDHLR